MPPSRHSSRADSAKLKAQIISKVGNEKAQKYFRYLSKLIDGKLSKFEFNKICIGTIGRENIDLHNQLIESFIHNALVAKTPPPKANTSQGSLNVKVANGYRKSSLQLLYGDAFPLSPRKGRSLSIRDRRFRDRPSPLGPNGKVHSTVYDESVSKTLEKRNVGVAELVSPNSRPRLEVISVEDGEEVEQVTGSPGVQSRFSVSAPFGIQINACGRRKTLRSRILSASRPESMQNTYELPDTLCLKKQLERKLESEGLGVTMDCANLLNKGLDIFLKGMIKPCLELAQSRRSGKQVNSPIVPGPNGLLPEKCMQRSTCVSASLLDFRAAMELKPQLLGENWPVHLERVCMRSSEE